MVLGRRKTLSALQYREKMEVFFSVYCQYFSIDAIAIQKQNESLLHVYISCFVCL